MVNEQRESSDLTVLSDEIENISGWGPYEIEEWTTGERIVLKRKENWWGDKIQIASIDPGMFNYALRIEEHNLKNKILK